MSQRPPSPQDQPAHSSQRPDTARPPRTRRGGDRAAYPGARAREAGASARATAGSRRRAGSKTSRHHPAPASSSASAPASVWTCGPEPIDAHHAWPVPIVEAATTGFTDPGARVLLVTTESASTATSASGSGEETASADTPARAAVQAVRALNRTADTLAFDTSSSRSSATSAPFWSDMPTGSATPSARAAVPSPSQVSGTAATTVWTDQVHGARRDDLVLVSLPARAADTVDLDELAWLVADTVRCGGTVAVYTHSDWVHGRLVDPTGPVVAACQNADLLYLQHIVALHTPIRDHELRARPTPAVAAEYHRAQHRAHARQLPAPHLRAHSDLLVFSQPADPGTPPPSASSTTTNGHGASVTAGRA